MNQKSILILAAISGALAVGIGAFGAHGLKVVLASNGRTDVFETAVRYHFYHTFSLLVTGILISQFPGLRISAWFFLAGIVVFSGSLYVLALTNQPKWGAVAPVGGLAFIIGWLTFAWTIFREKII